METYHSNMARRWVLSLQREGRIIRQGNENKDFGGVDVFRYVTEATFDAYLYQTIENKQRFISQVMSSKSPVRSCEDMDETTLSYAEVKALCAGNPLIKEKMDLDVDVTRLKVSKANFVSQHYRLEDDIRKVFPQKIALLKSHIRHLESDLEFIKSQTVPEEGISPMKIGNQTFTDKEQAGNALLLACKNVNTRDDISIGSYRGFEMSVSHDLFSKEYKLSLHREAKHTITLGESALGNLTRINNELDGIEKRLESAKIQLETVNEQLEVAKAEVMQPFPQEAELAEKTARLNELNTLLNMDGNGQEAEVGEAKSNDVLEDKPPLIKSEKNSPLANTVKTEERPSLISAINDIQSSTKSATISQATRKNNMQEL